MINSGILKYAQYSQIDRICNPSKTEFVEQYGLPGKPTVILDAMRNWKAMWRWTADFFKTQHGPVKIMANRTYDPEDSLTFSVAEYMDYLESANEKDPYYMRGVPIDVRFPGISEDYEVPEYFKSWHHRLPLEVRPKWTFFYIGPTNSSSRMHIEPVMSNSWNAVISGRKVWVLYGPGQEDFLYSGEVDAFCPELDKHPLFINAKPLVHIQNPGEIIFIPSGWWHQVINEEPCISIAEYFINECNVAQVRDYMAKISLSDRMKQAIVQYVPEIYESS
jgi:histone arginine demethylase JMJD6